MSTDFKTTKKPKYEYRVMCSVLQDHASIEKWLNEGGKLGYGLVDFGTNEAGTLATFICMRHNEVD